MILGPNSAERVAQIKERFGLPIIKSISVMSKEDLDRATLYDGIADMVLFDAPPSSNTALPGGNGTGFDWQWLKNNQIKIPWLLAGGLTPATVGEAIKQTGAEFVDVSSGVERARGEKSPALIADFLTAATGKSDHGQLRIGG